MSVVIIGGRGYIGSRLTMFLRDALIIDADWFGERGSNSLDFRDAGPAVAAADVVVFLAGHSSIPMSRDDPCGAADGVAQFVWLCATVKRKCKLIYASSSSVYGRTGPRPVDERYPVSASDVYTWTKLSMEEYARLSGLETYGLRFGTVAGWSPNFRGDTVVNGMVRSALRESRVRVFNPAASRPILGIDDCCAAILSILTSARDRRGVYNLASFNTTVGRLGEEISQALGVTVEHVSGAPGFDFAISSERFERAFDFTFASDLRAIVGDLIEHGDDLESRERTRAA